jgi:hypothetical protein
VVAVFINASGQQHLWWRYSLMQLVSSSSGGSGIHLMQVVLSNVGGIH